MKPLLSVGALALTLSLLVSPLATHRPPGAPLATNGETEEAGRLKKLPAGLARKFAAMATFSPGAATLIEEMAGGSGTQDWIEHSTPGFDIPFSAFATARSDWRGLKARPASAAAPGHRSDPSTGRGRSTSIATAPSTTRARTTSAAAPSTA